MELDEKRETLRYLIQNLESAFGRPDNDEPPDVLDMLIGVILSQATTNTNSHRTFAALKQRFPTWAEALDAPAQEIKETIRLGGLAQQKTRVIQGLLQRLQETRGELSLEFLHATPLPQAVAYLQQMRGIGPKTIACTLLFACKKDIFPLDTHIFRILRRAAFLPAKCTDTQAHAYMDALIPPGKFYSLHINLINLGRAICAPQNPRCARCPIVEYCDYGQNAV